MLNSVSIQEANSLMAEEMQTYNLLDMLHADASFLQVVLQIKLWIPWFDLLPSPQCYEYHQKQ